MYVRLPFCLRVPSMAVSNHSTKQAYSSWSDPKYMYASHGNILKWEEYT